jgi:hypothetical protein
LCANVAQSWGINVPLAGGSASVGRLPLNLTMMSIQKPSILKIARFALIK